MNPVGTGNRNQHNRNDRFGQRQRHAENPFDPERPQNAQQRDDQRNQHAAETLQHQKNRHHDNQHGQRKKNNQIHHHVIGDIGVDNRRSRVFDRKIGMLRRFVAAGGFREHRFDVALHFGDENGRGLFVIGRLDRERCPHQRNFLFGIDNLIDRQRVAVDAPFDGSDCVGSDVERFRIGVVLL